MRDIGSSTVGLVGYGNIAKRVQTTVTAMGAEVVPLTDNSTSVLDTTH